MASLIRRYANLLRVLVFTRGGACVRCGMIYRKRGICWLLSLTATSLASPVFAVNFSCGGTHNPVARTICALYPKIVELDS